MALLKEKLFSQTGLIYHVSAYRIYGTSDISLSESVSVEEQYNLNIFGLTHRQFLLSTKETSPYLRLDAGLAWITSGSSVLLLPNQDATGAGFGANLGLGMAFKTSFGSFNVDVFHSLYGGKESQEFDSGMTNFSLGFNF